MKTFSYGSNVSLLIVDDGGCYGGCRQRDGGQAAMVPMHFRHVSGRRWCFQMLLSDWADNGATMIGEMEC
ncbi:hypothetical protein Hanom_Chr09g00829531 [Helianthus anomalus]